MAMNSTVMSGTPRTNSMNTTQANLTIGSLERRPSASSTPRGSETTMPTVEITSVTSTPPHKLVETLGSPSAGAPVSRKKAVIGKIRKKNSEPKFL